MRLHQAASRAKVLPARSAAPNCAVAGALLLALTAAFAGLRAQSPSPRPRANVAGISNIAGASVIGNSNVAGAGVTGASVIITGASVTVVTIDSAHELRTFSPAGALGAGVDGHGKGTLRDIYTPTNVAAMRSAGLRRLTYRLRTELGVEAWHWNPRGHWSDSVHARGYWISDSASSSPIILTHGYRLPRRGNTIDQADNTGYSRLDDGDTSTFWKSNPYLDPSLDREDPSPHPQWVLADLGSVSKVSAIRIAWANPFATDFRVQYWKGEVVDDIDESPDGRWVTFPRGDVHGSAGGDQRIALADAPIATRFVRIVLTASSHTAPQGASDPRDSAGYAIREFWIGRGGATGAVADLLRHGASRTTQSLTYASSTDPWHRATDIDLDLEQAGFDRVARSGLTNGLPMMVPVPVLFSTPEDGANELRFLTSRGYAYDRVELGEEPDGQFVTPEDYASLYLRWARALHDVAPRAMLGGPSFQSPESQVMMAWPEDSAGAPWMTRFLTVLRARGRVADFGFLSFEWYPFDDVCVPTAPQLASAPSRLADAMRHLEAEGVPSALPKVIAEYGYSAFASRAEVDIEGALFDAELVGRFLSLGGATAFLYGYEPTYLDRDPRCDAWGNNALFLATSHRDIRHPLASYHAIRLLTHEWLAPIAEAHSMYAATASTAAGATDSLLSAFAVKRPDGKWAVLLVNRDAARGRSVRLRFASDSISGPTTGLHDEWVFSRAQYRWRANGAEGYPNPARPPHHRRTRDETVVLPPYSLAVVRASH